MPEGLETAAQDVWSSVHPYIPKLGVALAILVGGGLLAYVLQAITFAALKRTNLDNRLAESFGMRRSQQADHRVEHLISKSVFYLALAFVFVAFFGHLNIDGVTEPVVSVLNHIAAAVPNLLKALVIGVAGFLVASVARRAVAALIDRTGLSERLARMSGEGPESHLAERASQTSPEGTSKLAGVLGEVTYWVILAIVAVPVLDALRVGALATPLTRAFEAVTTYLPRIVGAGLLLAFGYVAGRVLGKLTSGLTRRIGVDRLVQRLGGRRLLGSQTLSGVLGAFVMAFVLLHFAISAAGRLDIPEISLPLGRFLDAIYTYLPRLFVGAIVLAIGVVLARIAGNITSTLLAAMGFNTLMDHIGVRSTTAWSRAQESQARSKVEARREGQALKGDKGEDRFLSEGPSARTASTPADFVSLAVSLVIGVIFLSQALRTLELSGLAQMLDAFIAYLPHAIAAVVALGAAMWAGRWTRRRVDELVGVDRRGDRLMRSLGPIAQVAVVAFGAMVALHQLGVASALIGTAFGLVLGALCLAAALAFGLGAREVAGDIVKREYERRGQPSQGKQTAPGPAE